MNNYRAELDSTGALNAAGSLRGRVVAVNHDRREMARPSRLKRPMLYGALEMDLVPETTLMLGASYQQDRNTGFNASFPRYADGTEIGFPRDINLGAPWNWMERENKTVLSKREHRLRSGWLLKAQLRYIRFNEGMSGAEIENAPAPGELGGADWWIRQSQSRERETSLDVNVQAGFAAFGQGHEVMVGWDMHRTSDVQRSRWPNLGHADIFDRTAPADPGYALSAWAFGSQSSMKKSGLYGSLRWRSMRDLAVILGGRDTLKGSHIEHEMDGLPTTKSRESHVFVPCPGAVYGRSKTAGVYASAAEIYQSQAGEFSVPLPGEPLDPVRGRTYELGIKGQWAGAALFHTEKKGQGVADPAYPQTKWFGGCCHFRDGYQLSPGIDLKLTGRIAPNLQMAVGSPCNEHEDKRQCKGNAQFSTITPRYLFKAWLDCRLGGALRGWNVATAVVAQASTFRASSISADNPVSGHYDGASTPYQFTAAGDAIWSARLGYVINKDWSIAMNVGNLFDETCYSTVGYAGYGNFYGEKRTATVTLKGKF